MARRIAGARQPAGDLTSPAAARTRTLYFSEQRPDLGDPEKDPDRAASYYITVKGAVPKVFDMHSTTPDITVEQGAVEDWIIENRTREVHTFHIHQLHFQLMEGEQTMRDTVEIPYWDGTSARYPSVKLRMDFRSASIAGTFVYHCHILEHEDAGMMGTVRVVQK